MIKMQDMSLLRYIDFSILNISDAELISSMLKSSSSDYIKYFNPFEFDVSTIQKNIELAKKDVFFGIRICQKEGGNNQQKLLGLYMLRGLDEGYENPMYGVFVDQEYSNKGIGRLTISHAECFCKLNKYEKLFLKVNPKNVAAQHLYKAYGFHFLREDIKKDNVVLCKTFPSKIEWL